MSMTRWPSGNFKPIVTALDKRSKKDYHKISSDILNVRVYLHSLTKEVVEEEVAYTEENFLSDIGGQLGLWAGFSVLSLIEIIELFCLFINACVRRNRIKEKDPDKKQRDVEMERM
ncbi:degenerin-like protein asic-2 [Mizuhopecten yessoensis]|uniref:degenerin-like protein asic-2 n=1 Tax=Mizuhopecten yessoensis TaxID=6573 RepID=UPI000B457575|nr:degenerin-like protein asic-2 [Mizuhopecten yessoensis]